MIDGSNFDTPIMYQDLANYTMSPLNMGFGNMTAGIGNSNYLGGAQMPSQLSADKVDIRAKKDQEAKSTLKKVGIAAAVILAICTVPSAVKGLRKNIKNAGGIIDYFKGLFKSKPKPAKPSLWQRIKNIFSKNPAGGANQSSKWSKVKSWFSNTWTKMKGKPNKWSRFKSWTANKWQAVKNVFNRNKNQITPNP